MEDRERLEHSLSLRCVVLLTLNGRMTHVLAQAPVVSLVWRAWPVRLSPSHRLALGGFVPIPIPIQIAYNVFRIS